MVRFRLVVMLVVAGLGGCQGCLGCSTSPVDRPGSTLPRTCEAGQPLIEPQKLDILFVIDNSNSMREEQEAVARELTAFVDEVKKGGGVRQDFHVGVITTNVYLHSLMNGVQFFRDYGNGGRLRPVPTVLPDGGLNLEGSDERILTGDDPELVSKFGRLVQQGTAGSGQETPFEALRLALSSELATLPVSEGGNGGFLRDGARLLIVLLTDEDDCSETVRPSRVRVSDNPSVADCTVEGASLTPVSEYQRMLSELQDSEGQRREIIFTAIGPVGRASKAAMSVVDGVQVRNIDCPTSNQAGLRVRQMAEAFDSSLVNLDSICRDNFRETLIRIAELASVSQVLEVRNIPDPRMLQVAITRKDGSLSRCSTLSGLTFEQPSKPQDPLRIFFGAQCRRRADDQSIAITLLCAT
jgi:hypothetical protein